MNPYVFIGLPRLERLQYLNKSYNLILGVVSKVTGVSVQDITGKSRIKSYAIARHYSVYFLRKYAQLSLKDVGALIGNRDHSTILWSLNIYNNSLMYPDFKDKAEIIEKRLSKIINNLGL